MYLRNAMMWVVCVLWERLEILGFKGTNKSSERLRGYRVNSGSIPTKDRVGVPRKRRFRLIAEGDAFPFQFCADTPLTF